MTTDTNPSAHDCCAPPAPAPAETAAPPARERGLGFGLGAAGAAMVASACCWLPLALIALGASSAGVGATFERWRPLMLGITAVLLAVGFWFAYRPQRCAPGSACATVPPAKRSCLRLSLWAITVFTAVMAAFPWYASWFLVPTPPVVAHAAEGSATLSAPSVYRIEGMTCAACAINLQRSLSAIPGVQAAEVDYVATRATVHWTAEQAGAPDDAAVRQATAAEGYQVSRQISAAP